MTHPSNDAPAQELEVLDELLAGVAADPGQLLPALQRVQARCGYVSPAAMRYLAQVFNLSRAEVYGVVTFYHDLREAPVGRSVVQLCMAEACQAVGGRELASHAEQTLGVVLGQTTVDGRVHLEAAYCFGNCALGPNVRIGDDIHARVSPSRFDELVSALP